MKKLIAMLLAIVLCLTCFAACGTNTGTGATDGQTTEDTTAKTDSDLAYIQDKGKIIVGITDYAPMDYKDENGEWTGFDAEFARMVAKEIGVEVEFFVLSDWGMKFNELETKNIDVVWNGMTITDEALANASVSDPYVVNAQVVVMKADVVGNYKDAESMKELTFAVEDGSAGADALDAAGITGYVALQDQTAALMEVKAGTADACVIDITMANAMTGEGTNYAELAAGISLTSEEYGIACRKGSDLTAKINELMDKFMKDGSLKALADKYELTLAE